MNAHAHWHAYDWAIGAALVALALASLGSVRRRRHGEVAAFAAGWLAFAGALLSPLDALAATRFWIHMVQHELLMLVAAPLLVIGDPLRAWSRAVPNVVLRPLRHATPIAATLLHAAALWVWHVPALYQAGVASDGVHAVQHASFVATALLFWWTVLRRAPGGVAILCVAATMIHMGLLGALLTFAPAPLYDGYALRDQQLGGLIMWVPAAFVMLLAGLWAFDRWLRFQS